MIREERTAFWENVSVWDGVGDQVPYQAQSRLLLLHRCIPLVTVWEDYEPTGRNAAAIMLLPHLSLESEWSSCNCFWLIVCTKTCPMTRTT